MTFAILTVCTGNICRSPTAEALFRHAVQQRKLTHAFTWDSAGTMNYHVGESADPRTIRTAASHGIAMDDLRARQVRVLDFAAFDVILAMDAGHLRQLQRMAPADAQHKLHLYLPYAGYTAVDDVPDPYYGPQRGFDEVFAMIEDATEKLIARLTQQR